MSVTVCRIFSAFLCVSHICIVEGYTGIGETKEYWDPSYEMSYDKNSPKEYWMALGKYDLFKARQKRNMAVAKNVILMVGDGMGMSTVTSARILKGQLSGNPGEETILSFERFPYTGLSKVYSQDSQVPDSSSTATAMLSGVKTNRKLLGVDARTIFENCSSSIDKQLETMLDWARAKGKSVGVVTNTRLTGATVASLWAKSPSRYWENDQDMKAFPETWSCSDIAAQLIDNNIDIKVLLGGGRRNFLRNTDIDPETEQTNPKFRTDNRNLIEEWIQKHQSLGNSYQYVWNASAFYAVNPNTTDYLLGLFNPSDMQYVLDRHNDEGGEPSLDEMTEKAIRILSKNPNGYFLLAEGGRIDHGHHANQAKRALYETVEFADAVEVAGNLTSEEETLTIVTADHSHVFTMGGYSNRGNSIFGLVGYWGEPTLAEDNKPYTTLMYTNGPGAFPSMKQSARPDPSLDSIDDKDYRQQAHVPLVYETHAGEDVAIYAKGPMSHLVCGVHEQSYIAHVMAFASCVGPYSDPRTCATNDVTNDIIDKILQLG